MFTQQDPETLKAVLDVFQTPMFATERASPDEEFRVLCVNTAYETATGLKHGDLQGRRPQDVVPEEEARRVIARYESCLASGRSLRYRETVSLATGSFSWDSTIQPVFTGDARQRILGTALLQGKGATAATATGSRDGAGPGDAGATARAAQDSGSSSMAFDDIRYFSAQAVFQLSQVSNYLEAIARHEGQPTEATGYAQAIVGICRSIDRALSDIRGLAEQECAAAAGRRALPPAANSDRAATGAAGEMSRAPEVANVLQGLSQIVARMG